MARNYHHGNLRNDLITEGLSMLCNEGVAAFSLRDLSKRLGVSHTAAYRHFSTKEELLQTIYAEATARFRTALAQSVDPDATGLEALHQLGVGYVRFFVEEPRLLTLFTLIPAESDLLTLIFGKSQETGELPIEIGPHQDCGNLRDFPDSTAFGHLRRLALALRNEDKYKGLSDREILLGFWGKVHGIATILVTQRNFIPKEQIDETIERVVRTWF